LERNRQGVSFERSLTDLSCHTQKTPVCTPNVPFLVQTNFDFLSEEPQNDQRRTFAQNYLSETIPKTGQALSTLLTQFPVFNNLTIFSTLIETSEENLMGHIFY
jgi:hypothetical protein